MPRDALSTEGQTAVSQHSPAGPCPGPDHWSGRRSGQGLGDRGGAEGTPDQRVDYGRTHGKRHPEAVAKSTSYWAPPAEETGPTSSGGTGFSVRLAGRNARCRLSILS